MAWKVPARLLLESPAQLEVLPSIHSSVVSSLRSAGATFNDEVIAHVALSLGEGETDKALRLLIISIPALSVHWLSGGGDSWGREPPTEAELQSFRDEVEARARAARGMGLSDGDAAKLRRYFAMTMRGDLPYTGTSPEEDEAVERFMSGLTRSPDAPQPPAAGVQRATAASAMSAWVSDFERVIERDLVTAGFDIGAMKRTGVVITFRAGRSGAVDRVTVMSMLSAEEDSRIASAFPKRSPPISEEAIREVYPTGAPRDYIVGTYRPRSPR